MSSFLDLIRLTDLIDFQSEFIRSNTNVIVQVHAPNDKLAASYFRPDIIYSLTIFFV